MKIIGNKNFEIEFKSESNSFFKEGQCKNGISSSLYRFKHKEINFEGTLKLC